MYRARFLFVAPLLSCQAAAAPSNDIENRPGTLETARNKRGGSDRAFVATGKKECGFA